MVTTDGADDAKRNNAKGAPRRPVDAKTRARVRRLARLGDKTRNAIAKEVGISSSTVSLICAAAKPPISFDRSKTRAALEARTFDLKAARAVEAQGSIELAIRFRELMFEPRTVKTTDGNGSIVEYDVDPGPREWKDTMLSYGIALDKHLVLVKADSDDRDLPALDQWLEHLAPSA